MVTLRRQIGIESIFLISLVAGLSLFFVYKNNQVKIDFGSNMSISSPLSILPTQAPEQNIFSQISPDGSKKVIMRITRNEDDTQTYTFYTADASGVNEQSIFVRTLDKTKTMGIPFNTWSPDNKYFFIQENAPDETSIFAFKGSGGSFSNEEQYLDVTDLFLKKETGNNFFEATGWASESLIIINTTKEDGKKGPSYWFEIPSKAIIQLSTEF